MCGSVNQENMNTDLIFAIFMLIIFLITVSYLLLRESPKEKTKP